MLPLLQVSPVITGEIRGNHFTQGARYDSVFFGGIGRYPETLNETMVGPQLNSENIGYAARWAPKTRPLQGRVVFFPQLPINFRLFLVDNPTYNQVGPTS